MIENISIAFIDVLGLPYDGNTLERRGLGGSEASMIRLTRQLAKIGFDVTVFNNCHDDDCKPGTYDGVNYANLRDIAVYQPFDIAIASRTVVPFTPAPNQYDIVKKSRYKIIWCHDTFIDGDEHTEKMLLDGHIHRMFTLSDFHTSYMTTCQHGQRRNFEVLKNKVWQTRNGVDPYLDWVDVKKKDPNLFVYNASVSKGMTPLVTEIWPRFKTRNPDAELIIIGGFYRFPNKQPDEQEQKWHELVKLPNKGIKFTGIIPQSEVANILSRASYFLCPGAFPETFGISILEALVYNTPVIGCRFGACEETAVAGASYLIDYAVVPNSLYPTIDPPSQNLKFLNMMESAYHNKYLHQQKSNYASIVREVCGWDTVALQWKQHFYRVLGKYMPVEEYRKVKAINYRVHQIFNRRFANEEDFL